jgi:starch synthase
MKIALVTSEAVPFAKTGGMGDVCGALPLALEDLGEDVIVIMPKYQSVHFSGIVLKPVDADFDVATIGKGIKFYFLRHDMYLREGFYGGRLGDYPDNLKRFSYFCKKALGLFKKINFSPDVIHCHDWQTALIPVYMKAYGPETFFPRGKKPKTLLTIHNVSYQGIFQKEEMPQTELGWEYFSLSGLEYYDHINLLKGGILYADALNTVSLTHVKEMMTEEFGYGLEGVLSTRKDRFFGITNGLDYRIWNPQGDALIFRNYSQNNLEAKTTNKLMLQELCGLTKSENIPLLGFVGRLVEQKGIGLLTKILPQLCKEGVQVVVLGMGDVQAEAAFASVAKEYPSLVFSSSRFDEELAHRIYAGSDIFLMPSYFEPCGIGQLISFKYGTVPLVYKTGGLADTVTDYNFKNTSGTGFVFTKYDEDEFLLTVKRARQLFEDKKKWQGLVNDIMRLNFSWKESAKKYIDLYKKAARL